MTRFAWLKAGLAGVALAATLPASADVKQGVDAWQRGDYAGAVGQWRPLALSGDADAQFNMGQAYKLGRGVPADLGQAEQWYRRAAQQGHPQAEDNLGLVLFQNGKRAEALPWLEKSAARSEPRAQYVLGTALFNGDFIAKDWPRAYALMTRASAAGLPQASQTLAQMDQFIPLDDRQKGGVMARQLETTRAKPETSAIAKAAVPPAQPAAAPGTTYPPPGTKTTPPAVAAKSAPKAAETSKPPVKTAAAPKPAPSIAKPEGSWRIQLGAFSDEGRAKALWGTLQPKVKGLAAARPHYVKAGALTRLQAGPFADKAEADRQCGAVKATGQACLSVKP